MIVIFILIVGFPHQKNEHWKYTNLKKFQSLKFSQPNNFNYSKNNFNCFDSLNIPTITIINGQINGLSIGSANGQLSFSHNNKVSTFSVGSDGKNSRILANLHQNKWLRLIPGQSISNYKDLNFSINDEEKSFFPPFPKKAAGASPF